MYQKSSCSAKDTNCDQKSILPIIEGSLCNHFKTKIVNKGSIKNHSKCVIYYRDPLAKKLNTVKHLL